MNLKITSISTMVTHQPVLMQYRSGLDTCCVPRIIHFLLYVFHSKLTRILILDTDIILQFLEIIQEFETQQRRAFLLFMTGSPRLPPGGLASLEPKLTVVYKVHSSFSFVHMYAQLGRQPFLECKFLISSDIFY